MTVLEGGHHLSDAIDEPLREPRYGTATVVIGLSATALVAVAVVPTIPLTTTAGPGDHRLLRAARSESIVALSSVPARWL